MDFINHTLYTKCEDLKRLKFIQDNVEGQQHKPLEILEVGCGNGNMSFQLAQIGHKVTGIDLSNESIAFAKKTFKNTNLQFYAKAAEDIIGYQLYDVILCSEVLEHLYHPDQVLVHLNRMLRTNGIAIITVPNGKGPRERLITKPIQRMKENGGSLWKFVSWVKQKLGYKGTTIQSESTSLEHIQFFSLKNLKELASSTGFEIHKINSANFIEAVFPFSLVTKVFKPLQKFDCMLADKLPFTWSSGFYTVMHKKNQK
jgi:ubiquinone/menaquinone biosynthesis C-methylase UbiE